MSLLIFMFSTSNFLILFELANFIQESTKETVLTFDVDLITHEAGLKREENISK